MERDYTELFAAGTAAQLEKLVENEDKGGWDDLSIDSLMALLEDEVAELREAFHNQGLEQLREEAADVANFAHMLILAIDKADIPTQLEFPAMKEFQEKE